MKWPFRRKQNIDNVPQEIQEYYQTEQRERTGVAWLLALGTLLITVGLAVLLFFGGRWIYRSLAGNDAEKSPETSQVTQAPADETDNAGDASESEPAGQTEGATTDSQTSSTSTDRPNTQPGGQTQGAATNGSGNLPSTGPGETLAVVAATVAVASAAHYVFSKES